MLRDQDLRMVFADVSSAGRAQGVWVRGFAWPCGANTQVLAWHTPVFFPASLSSLLSPVSVGNLVPFLLSGFASSAQQ